MVEKDRNWNPLINYLIDQDITPKEALAIIKSHSELNPTNKRTQWKMYRLSMFLWARIEEDKAGYLGKKADTIRRLIETDTYKKMFEAFNNGKLDSNKEFKNLQYLLNDPRQAPFLKSKYHVFKNTQKPIPQELIDKLK